MARDFGVVPTTVSRIWERALQSDLKASPRKKVTNECDLTFSRALQSSQWAHGVYETTVDGLIHQVLRAFDEFEPRKIEFGFLTHQCCLNEILAIHGNNDYKIPHIGKASLLAQGLLPLRIRVADAAMEVAIKVTPELQAEV